MEAHKYEGQHTLIEKVINKGLCVRCGACVGLCPYFDYFDGTVIVMDKCSADTWRCLQVCPVADFEGTRPDRGTTGIENSGGIGRFKKVIIARAADEDMRRQSQYGGVASCLLIYSLNKGFIKSAVLTDKGGKFSPGGMIAKGPSDIFDCGQSRYSASGTLSALNRAIKEGQDRIGVVGLPCQMDALERMRLSEPDGKERSRRIAFKIGLFCTWAIDYRALHAFLIEKSINTPAKKFDIPPPPSEKFCVQTEKGWVDFPLDSVRPFIQKGCTICRDMTAENADISIGTLEGREGWNTVIIRTSVGEDIINSAESEGWLDVDSLADENFSHLMEASLNKRKRALNNYAE
ncbi:MAG: Coenzyme F420 hydrogenase/dehydrogenase, beta subunit C-terminal domain [Deltaproteobacteria bacterium]|nr:Coenzyme F420 hydrogenase/dehydrogenase, beta subunit C-terminal domain [Deltaproteobacteria bacterium]